MVMVKKKNKAQKFSRASFFNKNIPHVERVAAAMLGVIFEEGATIYHHPIKRKQPKFTLMQTIIEREASTMQAIKVFKTSIST